jgi:bifunctional DNase/RNase
MDNIRSIVMEDSVMIEEVMAEFLAYTLKIETDKTKKELPLSFISFDHKCKILKEMKAISTKQYTKLKIFSEIRNKFAHNIRITQITDCFSKESQTFKNLVEYYPEVQKDEYAKYAFGLYEILRNDLSGIDLIGYYEG